MHSETCPAQGREASCFNTHNKMRVCQNDASSFRYIIIGFSFFIEYDFYISVLSLSSCFQVV